MGAIVPRKGVTLSLIPMPATTVFGLLVEAAERYGDAPALYQPTGGEPGYRVYSWSHYRRAAEEIAAGLLRIGIRKGDVVALASETRAELYLADLGVMAAGGIAAALYTSYPAAEEAGVLRACDARAVFIEDAKALRRLRQAADPPPEVQWILLTGEAEGALSLEELRRLGRQALSEDPELRQRMQADVSPSDPAILYLTSGATGEPKMALVSHQALVANIQMGPPALHLDARDSMLAFLPAAHITQRVVVELLPILCGVPVWFSESLMRLPEELRSVEPTIFVAPPRLWERVHASIRVELAKRPAWARRLFQAAFELGLDATRRQQAGQPLPAWRGALLGLADRILFRRLRSRFGRRMRVCGSGSAPLGKGLAEFYMAIGLPLIEGYGLTEGGVVVMNPLEAPRPGSIGRPLPGVEVRLAEDGELLLRSPSLFSGYYRDPAATAQVLRDGWLHTGDLAEIDADGYVHITGRKKELIVASNGSKIFPARIEALFRMEPVVSHVLVVGDRRPYIAALVTVNTGVAESLQAPLGEAVKEAVERVNRCLAPFEQIRKFRVLERDFSIEKGELTPTLKLRRSRILENFRDVVRELYGGKDQPG